MGRPTDNPKDTPLFVRLDQECREILTAYCEEKNVNKAEAARRGIKKLKDDLKKWRKRRTTQQSHHRFPPTNNRQKAGAA